MTIATILATNADWNKDKDAFEALKVSFIAENENGELLSKFISDESLKPLFLCSHCNKMIIMLQQLKSR